METQSRPTESRPLRRRQLVWKIEPNSSPVERQGKLFAKLILLGSAVTVFLSLLPSSLAQEEGDSDSSLVAPTLDETSVGVSRTLEGILIEGSELRAKALDDREAPIVLRIKALYPRGSANEYDLEYYGLEPGRHDLGAYLERLDGADATAIPELYVTVNRLLPEGQVEPNSLTPDRTPRLGGYQLTLWGAGILWLIGLGFILFWRRRRDFEIGSEGQPASLADRLRPLVDRAVSGEASHGELARLERSLIAFWKKRLRLESSQPGVVMSKLKEHPEARGLINQLESWLHRPDSQHKVDVEALLSPYREISSDEVIVESDGGSGSKDEGAVQ